MAIMMFDFDCLNKNRMDLSLAENLVHRGDAPGVIDEWFQVAHLLHERNGKELLRAAAEEAENSANSLQKEQAAGNMAQGGLGKKDPVPKQSGVKRDRSAMNEHNQHQEEEEEEARNEDQVPDILRKHPRARSQSEEREEDEEEGEGAKEDEEDGGQREAHVPRYAFRPQHRLYWN